MGQRATAAAAELAVLAFEDGLGRRYRVPAKGERDVQLELLCVRAELADADSFEAALRDRANRLSTFQHEQYSRVRRVDRLNGGALMLFSESRPGVRLSRVLAETEQRGLVLDISAALCVLRQLAPAVAALHESALMANGALGPERLLTPQARLVVIEHAVGGALEHLRYSRARYWQDLRVAVPFADASPFDERTDVMQLGMVGLALVIGRPIRDDEYPDLLEDLVATARARSTSGVDEPLSAGLRSWLARALQLEHHQAFRSPAEAHGALEQLFTSDGPYSADPESLEAFLARFHAAASGDTSGDTSSERSAAPTSAPPSTTTTSIGVRRPATLSEVPRPSSQRIIAEAEEPPTAPPSKRSALPRSWIAAGVAACAVVAALTGSWFFMSSATAASNGTLVVETNPPGADVVVDGAPRGQTPLTLPLKPGPHTVVVRRDGEPRTLPVTIVAGATSSQYLDLPKAAVTTGSLEVKTDPSGARVIVDGQAKGTTPLTLTDLASGEHSVTLENESGAVTHTVVIAPGTPATLVVPLGATHGTVASGWMSVSAPVELQIYEQGRLLGTSTIDRIMLPAGTHEIEVASEPLGFRATRTVQVTPGKVLSVPVAVPNGAVSLNAVPWATVSIDGKNVGETPIGNLAVPIGRHEVVFSNPQLGEKRQVITVAVGTPVRTSVDFSQK
jgi:hypothetical protein